MPSITFTSTAANQANLTALLNQYAVQLNATGIGLAREGIPFNFVVFRPQKNLLRIEPRLEKSDDITKRLSEADLEASYDGKRYKIRVPVGGLSKHSDLISDILRQAHDNS